MVGHAYFTEKFSKMFCEFLENEINEFRVADLFWEEFYAKHISELTLYACEFSDEDILEFESFRKG